MKENDKNYKVKFTLKDENGSAIDFSSGDTPTFTDGNITTTNITTGDVEVKIRGKVPGGTLQFTAVTSSDCTVTSGIFQTTVADSGLFTGEAGDWQLQVHIDKQTATGNEVYLSDPVTITVWEALS